MNGPIDYENLNDRGLKS